MFVPEYTLTARPAILYYCSSIGINPHMFSSSEDGSERWGVIDMMFGPFTKSLRWLGIDLAREVLQVCGTNLITQGVDPRFPTTIGTTAAVLLLLIVQQG